MVFAVLSRLLLLTGLWRFDEVACLHTVAALQAECLTHMGEALINLKNFTAAAEMLDKAIDCLSSGKVWGRTLALNDRHQAF